MPSILECWFGTQPKETPSSRVVAVVGALVEGPSARR